MLIRLARIITVRRIQSRDLNVHFKSLANQNVRIATITCFSPNLFKHLLVCGTCFVLRVHSIIKFEQTGDVREMHPFCSQVSVNFLSMRRHIVMRKLL